MKLSGNKKIVLLGVILLIIAGIVVVALKGINVSLVFQQHESISLLIGKQININEIQEICNEVFKNKKVVLKKVELFDDSVSIIAQSITDEEKSNLIQKVNEKYSTEFKVEDITIEKISNVRVRDMVRPYILPIIISTVLIIIYMVIIFKNQKFVKIIGKIFGIILLTELALASIIAISRIPLLPIMVNLMFVIAIIELIFLINKETMIINSEKK